jgi:hypothetical protein
MCGRGLWRDAEHAAAASPAHPAQQSVLDLRLDAYNRTRGRMTELIPVLMQKDGKRTLR